MSEIKVNDGGGLFDKYGIIKEMLKKLDILADQRGALRCGLIWDLTQMLETLSKGLKDEDAAKNQTVEELKTINANLLKSIEGGNNGNI